MMSVDYDEFDENSYRGIHTVGLDDDGSKSYTGDPIKDYENVSNYLNKHKPEYFIGISSSFDNFSTDSKYEYVTNRKHQMIGMRLKKVKKSKQKA